MKLSEKEISRGCKLYTAEAALEYLVSILVTGSFFATLTKDIGFSDSLTGILSSVISLGCLFGLLSMGIRKQRMKGFVIALSVINQTLFLSLYLIPLLNVWKSVKTVLFTVTVILAYLTYNIAHPKKIGWLMSLVSENRRGIFTANKEIISLVSGMAFSFIMGSYSDYFLEKGQTSAAFLLTAAVMLIIVVSHTLTMAFTAEAKGETQDDKPQSLGLSVLETFKDKNVLLVTAVFVLYYISNYASYPFYGTYMINELGFNLKAVSALTLLGSVSRILVSKFWGRYADKNSFAHMIEKCFIILLISQLCVVFATPQTAKLLFPLYYIIHGIAMGGINSALINLIFDYVPSERRSVSLSVTQAVSGTVGFLTTLCVSPLVEHIQSNNNRLWGINIYAQQALTVISVAVTLLLIVFVRKSIINKKSS